MNDNIIIRADGVQKYFKGGAIKALDGVSAEIRTGEADKLRQRLSQIHTLRWQDNDKDE